MLQVKFSVEYIFFIIFLKILLANSHNESSFPYREYLNVSENIALNPNAYLCNGSEQNKECCDCVPSCFKTKSCCIDKLWNEGGVLNLNTYFDLLINKSKSYKELQCESVLPVTSSSGHTSEHIWMVVTCPESADQVDLVKCTNQSNKFHLPVFGSDFYFYRNPSCARCNDIHIFRPVNFSIVCKHKLSGKKSATENLLQNYESCNIRIEENDVETKRHMIRCDPFFNFPGNRCDVKDKHYNLCHAYSGRMGHSYKNFHCYKCDVMNSIFNDVPKNCKKSPVTATSTRGFFPWSITIQFDLKSYIVEKHNDVLQLNSLELCGNDEIYNLLQGKCIIYTNPNNYYDDVQCIKENGNLSSRNSLLAEKPQICINLQTHVNLSVIQFGIKHAITFNDEEINRAYDRSSDLITFDGPATSQSVWVLEIYNSYGLKNMYVAAKKKFTQIYSFNESNFVENRVCTEYETYQTHDLKFVSCCGQTSQSKYKYPEIALWYEANKLGMVNQRVSICKKFNLHSRCSSTVITNFTIDDNMAVIYYNTNNSKEYKLEFFQYRPTSDGVLDCNQFPKPKITFERKWISKLRNVEHHVCMIGTPMSIVCYMFIIGTYMSFKELKTIAGLNTCAMCFFLWLSDSIYYVISLVTFRPLLCKLLAIFLHWTLLSAYSWVVLIALDLMLRVSRTNYNPSKKSFHKCCFISIAFPSILVVTASAINEAKLTFHVGYGDHGICWIVGNYARVVFYAIPVAISFGFVILLLIYILFVVRKSKKKMSGCASKNVSLLKITMKLVLILGLPEIVGFFQQTKGEHLTENEEVMNYAALFLYTFLRSFRGTILFFMHVCNKKVFNTFKSVLKRNERSTIKINNFFDGLWYTQKRTSKSLDSTVRKIFGAAVIDRDRMLDTIKTIR